MSMKKGLTAMVIAALFMRLNTDIPIGLSGIATAHGGGNGMKDQGTIPVYCRI